MENEWIMNGEVGGWRIKWAVNQCGGVRGQEEAGHYKPGNTVVERGRHASHYPLSSLSPLFPPLQFSIPPSSQRAGEKGGRRGGDWIKQQTQRGGEKEKEKVVTDEV